VSFTKSLVISSAKIARTAFSFALSFLPQSPSDSPDSTPTGEGPGSGRHGPVGTEPSAPAEPGGNGLDERLEALAAEDEASQELRFIKLNTEATLPTRAHDSDAGLDLYAAEKARITPGARVSVGTGLAMQVPEGLAGLVLPRSGLALKHGIALVNAPGLIDPGYRGEVRILLLNTDGTTDFQVSPGDRIAQLLLVPIAHASPLQAEALDESVRGGAGFGSSGS
jgi:dUTP pyrophosphatase